MSTKSSELARGASMAADVWHKLDKKVKEKGGTDDAMHRLACAEGDAILDMFASHLVKVEAVQNNRHPVKMKHASLQEAIDAGKYDYANDDITAKHFEMPDGEIVVDTEIVLFHPDREIESDDAIAEMEQFGLRPATLTELLAFGETYPETQREFPIICLGSSWVNADGHRYVPYLEYWNDGRSLYLNWFDFEWYDYCRFAAVRK